MHLDHVALLALTLSVVYALGKWVVSQIQIHAFTSRAGCRPAAKWGQLDPILGIDQFRGFRQRALDRTVLEGLTHRYLAARGHTLVLRIMAQPMLMTCEPENVQAILATKFNDFGLGTRLRAMGRLLGRGIFTTDGAHWEHSRALIRPSFTRARVADLECVETHVQNLLAKLPADGETVDMQRLFFHFTIDNSTEFLLGHSLHCQTNPDMAPFVEAWDRAEVSLVDRVRLGRLVGLADAVRKDARFEAACDTVHAVMDNYMAGIQRGTDAGTDDKRAQNTTRRYNLLSELSAATRDDPTQTRNELLNVLLAARDTTAGLLSSIVYFLARHADVWAALAAEVGALEGRAPDYATLKGMHVLRSIVCETLRLHPPVPINMRFAIRNTTIPRGGGADGRAPVFVAKGTAVQYSVWAMHRLPEVYGDDAEVFRPGRWREQTQQPLRPGWAYLPFNGGPRVCLGQQSALTEASYVVVRLVQHCGRVEARGGAFREHLALTLSHADGVQVALWRRG